MLHWVNDVGSPSSAGWFNRKDFPILVGSIIHWQCLMYSSTQQIHLIRFLFSPFSILDIRRRERSYRWIMTAHRHLILPRRMWTRWRSPWARWTFHLPVDHVEDMTLTPIIHLLHTLDQLEQRPLPILFHHLLQQGKTQKKFNNQSDGRRNFFIWFSIGPPKKSNSANS